MKTLGLVLLFLAVAAQGSANEVRNYVDSHTKTWTRQIITENKRGGKLFLVIDSPEGGGLPIVRFRKFLTPAALANLDHLLNYFRIDPRSFRNAPSNLTPSSNPLWVIKKPYWDSNDEKLYSEWVSHTVDPSFLEGSGISVDCAELALTSRWVFARENGLPAADTLITGQLFGHWMSTVEWDQLPTDPDWHKDERFKAALRFLLSNAYTHTLQQDLYPIEITSQYITPGAIALLLRHDDGDTQVLQFVGQDPDVCGELAGGNCIVIAQGDLPRLAEPRLNRLYVSEPKVGEFGIYRMRWPFLAPGGTWDLIAQEKMPGYSLDQFNHGWTNTQFMNDIMAQLGFHYTPVDLLLVDGRTLTNKLAVRDDITSTGYFFCSVIPCQPGTALYNSYSTPELDQAFNQLSQSFVTGAKQYANDNAVKTFLGLLHEWGIVVGSGDTAAEYVLNENQILSKWDSDPRSHYYNRWGYDPQTVSAQLQALYAPWSRVWHQRDSLEAQAQQLCFPQGETQPVCDPSSPEVQALDTTQIDLALRKERAHLKSLFEQSDDATEETIREWATRDGGYYPNKNYCPWNDQPGNIGGCTVWDFLFSELDMVDVMTSAPTDTEYKRLGFPMPSMSDKKYYVNR